VILCAALLPFIASTLNLTSVPPLPPHSMSASKVKDVILSPATRLSIQTLQNEVFGQLPQLNIKTGYQKMKRMHRGAYIDRYYPEPVEKSARLVSWMLVSRRIRLERDTFVMYARH
jgi:hypothetical protein